MGRNGQEMAVDITSMPHVDSDQVYPELAVNAATTPTDIPIRVDKQLNVK